MHTTAGAVVLVLLMLSLLALSADSTVIVEQLSRGPLMVNPPQFAFYGGWR
jgi:hypothetical protein